jgi:hypothetical protein
MHNAVCAKVGIGGSQGHPAFGHVPMAGAMQEKTVVSVEDLFRGASSQLAPGHQFMHLRRKFSGSEHSVTQTTLSIPTDNGSPYSGDHGVPVGLLSSLLGLLGFRLWKLQT